MISINLLSTSYQLISASLSAPLASVKVKMVGDRTNRTYTNLFAVPCMPILLSSCCFQEFRSPLNFNFYQLLLEIGRYAKPVCSDLLSYTHHMPIKVKNISTLMLSLVLSFFFLVVVNKL